MKRTPVLSRYILMKLGFHLALPVAIFLLSVGAAIGYGFIGDWRRLLYWTAAAVITFAVTV